MDVTHGQPSEETALTRIVLADDHAVVRSALRMLLDADPSFEVVGEARSVVEALEVVRARRPDVVVLDLMMQGHSSLEAIPAIRAEVAECRVVVLTMYATAASVQHALGAGALGFVLKDDAAVDLIEAVRRAAFDESFVSQAARVAPAPIETGLTERQLDVLRDIVLGYTSPEIAAHLGLSVRTVESHRSMIQRLLGLHSRGELVRYALGVGLLSRRERTAPDG